jgi:DNA/RNA endonuclease YhcR with UshA esterase domain
VTAALETTDEAPPARAATPISAAANRTVVRICGRIAYVEVAAQQGPAQLLASIDDGTGAVEVVFMGRRIIPGIRPGQPISVTGRLVTEGGVRRIYNPHYELACRA